MRGLFWGVVAAYQNDLGLGCETSQLISCFDAAHFRHHNIHHHHVGFDLAHTLKGGFAACRFIHFPMRLLDQQGTEGVAYKLLVINYEDFGWYRHIASGKASADGRRPVIALSDTDTP